MSPTTDEQALHLSRSLARAHASLQRLLDERLGMWHGLSQADFLLLDVLADAPQGRMPTLRLSQALQLAPSTLIRQLLPLHKTGLLAREDGAVQLRPAGRRLHAEAAQTVGAACGQASSAARLDDDASEALCGQFDGLAHAAARIGSGARAR